MTYDRDSGKDAFCKKVVDKGEGEDEVAERGDKNSHIDYMSVRQWGDKREREWIK